MGTTLHFLELLGPCSFVPYYNECQPWPVWLSWLGTVLQTERSWFDSQSGHLPRLRVQFLARAHTKGNQSMLLSLSFSLPSPLSKPSLPSFSKSSKKMSSGGSLKKKE